MAGADCGCLAQVKAACQPNGAVLDGYATRGGCGAFGKPILPMRPRLAFGGNYQTFERGEIATYSKWAGDSGADTPAFVLSGALKDAKIEVQWGSTKPFSYEFFIVRWDLDDHAENVAKQHKDDKQQEDVKTPGAHGKYEIDANGFGTYVIYVEGCDTSGFILASADCKQGWSYPIYVDRLPTLWPFPVPIPAQPPPVISTGILDIPDQVMLGTTQQRLILERLCGGTLLDADGDHKGEITTATMLAQLQMANQGWSCKDATPAQLRTKVNDAISQAIVVSQPGTDVSGFLRVLAGVLVGATAGGIAGILLGAALNAVFGGLPGLLTTLTTVIASLPLVGVLLGGATGVVLKDKPGDYDMRLTGLIQMVYRFPGEIDLSSRTKLLHELLTVHGPANERKEFVWISGVPTPVLETENHLWSTESARYLTNNLLANEVGQPVPYELDNDANGMTDWILGGLRLFLVQDFYELNSRPYAPIVLEAIQNLAEFAANGQMCLQVNPPGSPVSSRRCDVARAARNVLDFLATKFAVSSNELRRAAPFRRQPPFRDYPRLLTNGGDDLSWHYLAYTGGSDFLRKERASLLMEFADGALMQAFQSSYRPPVMITDLLRTTAGGTTTPLQRFRNTRRDADVVEVYYREPNFLISAGGKHDRGSGVAWLMNTEDAWALPTTLMPTRQGNDYRDFVRIAGNTDDGLRINTCVGPGFACGMNPVLPAGLPAACTKTSGNWTFINFADNTAACPFDFGFYVALYRERCAGSDCLLAATNPAKAPVSAAVDPSFGFFEATSYRTFASYMADVLALNGGWTYRYDKVNLYKSPTGRRVTFQLNASEKEWGIVDFDAGAGVIKPERRYDRWPVAQGEVMSAPKTACIIVDNERLQERLILDHADVNRPRRTIVSLPSRECTCPLADQCISPRGQ